MLAGSVHSKLVPDFSQSVGFNNNGAGPKAWISPMVNMRKTPDD